MEENKTIDLEKVTKPFYVEGRGVFVPIINKVVAMKDSFDGEPVEWKDAVKAGAPTRDEWYIILYFKDEINRLIVENGGDPIASYYWSSSEYSATSAWIVGFSSGTVYLYTGKYCTHYVRAVAAF